MRWKRTPHLKYGTHRTRTAFLWLPKNIHREVRWLQWATWQETFYYTARYEFWYPDRWIDDPL